MMHGTAPIKQPGLKDTTQNILDLLGDDTRSYTDWKKEAMAALHIAKVTFDRARDELIAGKYIEKCKTDGVKFEQYRKVRLSAATSSRRDPETEAGNE